MREYRSVVCASLLYRAFVQTAQALSAATSSNASLPQAPELTDEDQSVFTSAFVHTNAQPFTSGTQVYDLPLPRGVSAAEFVAGALEGEAVRRTKQLHPHRRSADQATASPSVNTEASSVDIANSPADDATANNATARGEAVGVNASTGAICDDSGAQDPHVARVPTNDSVNTQMPTGAKFGAVGRPLPHASAVTQATGEAMYTADYPLPQNGLEGMSAWAS